MDRFPKPAALTPPPTGRVFDLGSVVCDWIENNLVHGEGDYYGRAWHIEPFQRTFIRRLYAVDVETRRRIVRRALLVLPEGNGKTELIAAIMLAELAGPTAVDESLKPCLRRSPAIPCAAASYDQSDRLFGAAQAMAEHENSAISPFLVIGEKEIKRKSGPGKLYRIAAVAGTNMGGLPTAFGADEVQEWVGKKERVHLVISNSLAKRASGLELNITTPDDADADSLLGKMVAYGKKVATGEVVDPTFLFMWYSATRAGYEEWCAENGAKPQTNKQLPLGWDLDDPAQLRAAIEEANPASWIRSDVDRVAARYEVDRIPRHEFERFKLSRFVRPSRFWLPGGAWEGRADPKRGLPADGSRVVLAFDGSYARDSTGLVVVEMDGHISVFAAWERPERAPDTWRVSRAEVDAKVHEAMSKWDVVEFVCDPHRWTAEIEKWEDIYGDAIVEFPTNTASRMAPACAKFYAAVVGSEDEGAPAISHDGDPRLSRHLSNAVTRETRDGAYITKEHRDSPRKIDLAVAAVMGYDRATFHASKPKRRSAYETRGMLSV